MKFPTPVNNITYNQANQMTSFDGENLAYDLNGNLIQKGSTFYLWNARNQLVGINGPNLTASFKYDALGRRIEKTINGKTVDYLYDGLDIVQEIEGGVVSANYIRTLNIDEPLARIKSYGTIRFYQQDALGSVVALTDETGAIKTQYVYDPYGNTEMIGEPSGQPFQYTGREYDGTGLYGYRTRYYSSKLHRFISEDPFRLLGGLNFFKYAGDSPTNFTDPFGLRCRVPFWNRALENFMLTNRVVPGLLAPWGATLITSGATAGNIGGITLLNWANQGFGSAVLQGVAFTGLEAGIIAAGTAAVNFAMVGLAWETGVGIGSIISAAILPCEEINLPTGECEQ